MSATNWGPVDRLSAAKRASARDSWNRRRMAAASIRRLKAVCLYMMFGCERGSQARIARILGVHRSFVCRAIALWYKAERLGIAFREVELYDRMIEKLRKQELRFTTW